MNKKEEKESDFGIDVEEMFKLGMHFGHKTSKAHPKMAPYLYGVRHGIHIIDLEKTKEKLKEVFKAVRDLILQKKLLMVVGTEVNIKDLVKEFAQNCGLPYVSERWLGGTFTNFAVIKKRIKYFQEMKEKKEGGEFDKYTKKERAKLDDELAEFERKFGGIKDLDSLPDAVFVLNMNKDNLAIKEAKQKNIKVFAISDSDTDPTLVDYAIPASDNSKSSMGYILNKLKETILKAKQELKDKEQKTESEKKKED